MIILVSDCLNDFVSSRRQFAKFLENYGYEVLVIVLGEKVSVNKEYIACNSLIKWFTLIFPLRHQIKIIDSYKLKPNLYNFFTSFLFRYITCLNINGLGRYFAYQSKFKVIRFLYVLFYKIIALKSDIIFVQNSCDRKKLKISKKHNVKLINGSGIILKSPTLRKGSKKFVFAGRLLKSKGVFYAIDLVRELSKSSQEYTLDIYGSVDSSHDGITLDEINDYIGLDKNISYLGHLNGLTEVFGKADLLLYPSFYGEGVPRVVLEAMSMGCKVALGPFCDAKNLVVPNQSLILTMNLSKDSNLIQNLVSKDLTNLDIHNLKSTLKPYSVQSIVNSKIKCYEEIFNKNL